MISNLATDWEFKPGEDVTFTVKDIGPYTAAKLLLENKSNRRIRKGVVEKYAGDMKAGDWRFTPNPICINKDGSLVNGQHRLTAIIDSGTTQRFLVCENVDDEAIAVLDIATKRNVSDVSHFMGYGELPTRQAAIARVVNFAEAAQKSTGKALLHRRGNISEMAVLNTYHRHKEPIDFVAHTMTTGDSTLRAPAAAVLVLCWYYMPEDEIEHMARVINRASTDHRAGDEALVSLREWMRDNKFGGSKMMEELFRRAMWCIKSAADGVDRRRTMKATKNFYPIREDLVDRPRMEE